MICSLVIVPDWSPYAARPCWSASVPLSASPSSLAKLLRICNDSVVRERIDRAININEICDINPFGVEALMAAYNESGWWIDQLCAYLKDNYDALRTYMANHLPEVQVTTLEGTYLVWLDIRSLGITSDEATERLLKEGKVLVNSGTLYGERAGEGFIRVNIACPRQQLMLALERMCKVLAK